MVKKYVNKNEKKNIADFHNQHQCVTLSEFELLLWEPTQV